RHPHHAARAAAALRARVPAAPPARTAWPQRGGWRSGGPRQRERRGTRVDRLIGRTEPRRRCRRRARAAATRLHAPALPLRTGDRGAAPDGGIAARRFVCTDQYRERPLHSAELRPAVQGPRVGTHRVGGLAQRASGANAGDGVARSLLTAVASGWPAARA